MQLAESSSSHSNSTSFPQTEAAWLAFCSAPSDRKLFLTFTNPVRFFSIVEEKWMRAFCSHLVRIWSLDFPFKN